MRSFRLLFTMTALAVPACVAGIDAGTDGQGGASSASTTSTTSSTSGSSGSAGATSSGGGSSPSGNACSIPRWPQCDWGMVGGPCGGGLPGSKDCIAELACVGESAGTPGTCVLAPDGGAAVASELQGPGGPCDVYVPFQSFLTYPMNTCPWNYVCSTPPGSETLTGVCVPGTCVLGDGTLPASGSSVTIDGDGPTQTFVYGPGSTYAPPTTRLTGEANAIEAPYGDAGAQLWVAGYSDPSGDPTYGFVTLSLPAFTAGPVEGLITTEYAPSSMDASIAGAPSYSSIGGMGTGSDVTLTVVDDTRVSGTFDVWVFGYTAATGSQQKHITGSFDVCRLPNYQGP